MERCFTEQSVLVVFHAAAYKHVPLVEVNPIAGLANNVLSTRVVCDAARRSGTSRVVLISTDKAVRPTNVIEASKRLAELVAGAAIRVHLFFDGAFWQRTRFFRFSCATISSPNRCWRANHTHASRDHSLFHDDSRGSPVGVASVSSAKGGDVLLLDMGEPVRIKALAEQMVRLSGLTLKGPGNRWRYRNRLYRTTSWREAFRGIGN